MKFYLITGGLCAAILTVSVWGLWTFTHLIPTCSLVPCPWR